MWCFFPPCRLVDEQYHSVQTWFELDYGQRLQHREDRKRLLVNEMEDYQACRVEAVEYKQELSDLRDSIYQLEHKKTQLLTHISMGPGR
eukprot:SAG31_NODE_225_length_19846_cov_19.057983_6_plen_89_part_00